MNNIKKILGLSTLALFALSTASSGLKVNAEEVEAFEIENVFNWTDNTLSYFDEAGAHGIRKANANDLYSNGIGLKQQLSVENGKTATVTFSIPDYNHETRTLKDGRVGVKQGEEIPYDIYLVNVDTGFYSIFRLWATNTTNPEQTSSWIQYCETKTSGWETYSGGYLSGVCTDASSYTIGFDTTNFFQAKCDWKEEGKQMVPFHELGEIGTKKDQYLNFMQTYYGNASQIEIWFAHQRLVANTCNEVVIKEINGESLAVTNGKFNDTQAPIVSSIRLQNANTKFELNAEYTLKVEKYHNDPSTKADLYVIPTSDATTAIDDLVAHSKLLAKHSTDTSFKEVGELDVSASLIKKISFDKAGKWELKLAVSDNANHAGESDILEINVVKGYSITLNGEVSSTGEVGTKIDIPTATASDSNGIEREYKVSIEDPLGMEVEVKDGGFIPSTAGVYYVTYTSSYTDGTTKISAIKVEREIIVTASKNNSNNNQDTKEEKKEEKGCKSAAIPSVIGLITIAGMLLITKKNK